MFFEAILMEGLMVLALLVVTQPLLHGPYRSRLQSINNAWKGSHPSPPSHTFIHPGQHSTALFVQNNDMKDGVTLTSLGDNEEIGMFLNNAIMQWLDEEYIPQDIHRILGEAVQKIYVKGRKDGVTDLGEMMMNVGTGLESVKMGDAFVNAWDVANKVSDLLMIKLDRELCDCAGDMSKFLNNEGRDSSRDSESSGSVFFCRFMDTSNTNSNSNIYSNAQDNNGETDNGSESKKKRSKSKDSTGMDSKSGSDSNSVSNSKLSEKSKPTIDLSGFLQTNVTRSVLTHQDNNTPGGSQPDQTLSPSASTTTSSSAASSSSAAIKGNKNKLTTSLRITTRQKVFKPVPAVVVDPLSLSQASRDLRTEFARYKLLRDFMEVVPESKKKLPFAGDVTWNNMHAALALCLGFRVETTGEDDHSNSDGTSLRVVQRSDLDPLGWDGMDVIPDMSNLEEELIADRMRADLPDDEAATDIVLETIAGLEMYQLLKSSTDLEVQRRILVSKWLYVQGFFNDVFPPIVRFVPAHRIEGEDNDDEEY